MCHHTCCRSSCKDYRCSQDKEKVNRNKQFADLSKLGHRLGNIVPKLLKAIASIFIAQRRFPTLNFWNLESCAFPDYYIFQKALIPEYDLKLHSRYSNWIHTFGKV